MASAQVVWQVAYDKMVSGGIMWWDYPFEISDFINKKVQEGKDELIGFCWDWGKRDRDGCHRVSEYLLDPKKQLVYSLTSGTTKRVRRVTIDPEHPGMYEALPEDVTYFKDQVSARGEQSSSFEFIA